MNPAMERKRRTILSLIATVLVTGGGVACAWLIETKPLPAKRSTFDRVLEVAVEAVAPGVAAQPVVSYGTVRAKHQVKIVPQVNGELVFVHKDLEAGKLIAKGEILFEIDPVVYEARVRQAEAEVNGLKASLGRADQEEANLAERLANVERMLAIDEADFQSGKRLYEDEQVGTQRDVDVLYQKYLRSKDTVIDLRSRAAIIPHAKRETQAQHDAAIARLEQAKHDLDNTKITCPFDARVELVSAYQSQVVSAVFSIATLTDMSAFELAVGIDPRELRWLDRAIQPDALQRDDDTTAGPPVRVTWSLHGQELTWRGHVSRFERVDEATRTAQLIVEVRDVDMVATVSQGNMSVRPTLSMGMHCRTELPAEALEQAVLVPRHAVYDNRWVYVFEPDPNVADGSTGRLARREVPLLRSLGDSVLVDYAGRTGTRPCELQAGELVVLSPLTKPIVGMELRRREQRVTSAAPAANPKSADGGGVARLASVKSIPVDSAHASVAPSGPRERGGR